TYVDIPDLHSFPTRRSSDLRKGGNTTGVKIIRNVISCPGRNPLIRNVLSAAAIWLRKEANWSAVRKPADMWNRSQNRRKTERTSFHATVSEFMVTKLRKEKYFQNRQ